MKDQSETRIFKIEKGSSSEIEIESNLFTLNTIVKRKEKTIEVL